MALSGLTLASAQQYTSAQFNVTPTAVREDSPDERVLPDLGGWIGTAVNEMYFVLNLYPNSECAIAINEKGTALNLNVSQVNRPQMVVRYYKVNMGVNISPSEWELDFDVYNDDVSPETQYTGKWKFTKGKVNDDGEYAS
jgi:hypothetical protein